MDGRAVPGRTVLTLGVLQTACGALTVASLVALGQPPTAVAAHDGATPLTRAYAAIPTEWDRGGPLAIPTIGVVPPGLEDWYDPSPPRRLPAFTAAQTPTVTTPATRSPVRSVDEPGAAPLPTTTGGSTDPTPTVTPQLTTPLGTTTQETTQETTTPHTTATAATQGTAAPTTSTPPATTEPTTTEPTTTEPTTTEPTTTEPTPPTDEPVPPPPPAEINERGNAVLGLGEQLTVLAAETGAVVLAVGVDSVSDEVTCTGPDAIPAANGLLIAVQVRATTGPDLTAVGGEPAVRAADFSFLAPDGVTLTPAGSPSAESCLPDTETFPAGPIGADQEFSGVVVLDVPSVAGTLVFAPEFLPVGGEWTY